MEQLIQRPAPKQLDEVWPGCRRRSQLALVDSEPLHRKRYSYDPR